MRTHNVKSHILTMGSALQNDHGFNDGCAKLSLTKFREVFNGTIDIQLPLGAVDANESPTEMPSQLC
jgi:hypothetical protein